MLILTAAYILISFSCALLGFIIDSVTESPQTRKHPVVYAISGLIGFTLVAQIFSLFMPVHLLAGSILVIAVIISAFLKKWIWKNFFNHLNNSFSSVPLAGKILVLALWLMILLIGAGPVMMDDTESYHIQMIKWIQEYGSVPGIVNLHERYGFNSSWFSSTALFSISSNSFNFYTILNLTLSCWFCYYLVSRCFKSNDINYPKTSFAFVLIAAFLVWPLIRGNAATANYDFITTMLVCILFFETYIEKSEEYSLRQEWLIWPVFLFTIRIINFPLLLISLVAIISYIKSKEIKKLSFGLLACSLLVIPFLARNVIISGYLFYPAPYIDLFDVDWKPAKETINQLLYYIKYYNRVSTTYLDLQQTEMLGETGWITSWFRYLFTYDKFIVAAGITGIVPAFFILRKNKTLFSPKILLAILLIQLVVWFVIGPDPRFVYGCLLSGIFLLPLILQKIIPLKTTFKYMQIFIVILIMIVSGYAMRKIINEPAYRNWISPKPLPEPEVKEYPINGITLRIPEIINNNWNPRCYGTSLPCIYELKPELTTRGGSIKNGFRLKK